VSDKLYRKNWTTATQLKTPSIDLTVSNNNSLHIGLRVFCIHSQTRHAIENISDWSDVLSTNADRSTVSWTLRIQVFLNGRPVTC